MYKRNCKKQQQQKKKKDKRFYSTFIIDIFDGFINQYTKNIILGLQKHFQNGTLVAYAIASANLLGKICRDIF